jgi:N-acetylmuramic acid 6-phosphate (MurNAc-6-P) etherase
MTNSPQDSNPKTLSRRFQSQLSQDPLFLDKLIHSLSKLPTESINPRTEKIAELSNKNLGEALKLIKDVELRSSKTFTEIHLDKVIQVLLPIAQDAMKHQHKIFLVGAGASGRMALFIKRALLDLSPNHPLTSLIEAVIAGGDAALIHAVPGFEDDPKMARLQLEKQKFNPQGDFVIGFSASGRAPFVLEALSFVPKEGNSFIASPHEEEGSLEGKKNNNARVLLISTNPESSFSPPPGIRHLSLYTEPPAVAGSTRLSPTTQMMIACGVFITMAVLDTEDPEKIQQSLSHNLSRLRVGLEEFPWESLALILEAEANQLKLNPTEFNEPRFNQAEFNQANISPHKNLNKKMPGRLVYEIEANPFTEQLIFHDLTERTPTAGFFPLRPQDEWEKYSHQIPFAYPIFTNTQKSTDLWPRLLGTETPFCLNLKTAPETLENALFHLDFSPEGGSAWVKFLKEKSHAVSKLSIRLTLSDGLQLKFESESSDDSGPQSKLASSEVPIATTDHPSITPLEIRVKSGGLIDLTAYFQAIFLKIVLNTYSTGLMAKLGMIYKNQMSHLMPTNEKLIARSILQIEERLRELSQDAPLKTLQQKNSISREKILEIFLEQLNQESHQVHQKFNQTDQAHGKGNPSSAASLIEATLREIRRISGPG